MKNKFNDLTLDELQSKRADLKKEFFQFRMDRILGHVESPIKKRTLRRQIARLNTLIHEKNAKSDK
jgi:large subunit ribosomal protein L29